MVRIMIVYTCDYPRCHARTEVEEHERPSGWSKTSEGEDRCPQH